MSFLRKFWRIPALALVITLPFVAACADDDTALPPIQGGDDVGSISGTVRNAVTDAPIVGALVGTNPATTTALTDGEGEYRIDNVPIPQNPTAYAVTATAAGFQPASVPTSLSTTTPNVTVNIELQPGAVDSLGDLNVLVVRRTGEPVEGATVDVVDTAGDTVDTATTNATGFAIFDNLAVGSYTVFASVEISGFDFHGAQGTTIRGGETSFVQITLVRDFDQSVFPNIDGDPVVLTDAADIRFVPVPGADDSNPLIDCNIIRTQHMFIAEVVDNGIATTPNLVSGVKVQWDLNISTQGICNVFSPFNPNLIVRCEDIVPGNTGSIVDSDDPDLDPAVARTGLTPAFNVDTRKAVTFTNDGDQVVSFSGTGVTVGKGQTWIIITSPSEGITDVIAATPDIPASDPDCANNGPRQCDKEFAVKRWVNWATSVAELEWPNSEEFDDPNDDPDAVFTFLDEGDVLSNVLVRSDEDCGIPIITGLQPADHAPGHCDLENNNFLIYAEVDELRADSPFTLNLGTIELEITDDVPDLEIFGEDASFDDGSADGVPNVSNRGFPPSLACVLVDGPPGCDDEYFVDLVPPVIRNFAEGEFQAPNAPPPFDLPGWVVFELRLDPTEFFCVDVDLDLNCDPGAAGSTDSFSTAYQNLLNGTADNTNSLVVRFRDEFGEICGDFPFDKEWVASRLRVIKSTPDATVRTVSEAVGGPLIQPGSTARPVKTHTIQVGQSFTYTITVINDGEVASENVRITDTLPRFGFQFDDAGSDDGEPTMRDGAQAFAYVTDRPTFDPIAVVYAVDSLNNDNGNDVDFCIRGDNGTTVGNAYVAPAQCFAPDGSTPTPIVDAGTVASARAVAEETSSDGNQIVWIQWFDDSILARQQPGGAIETEDTVEVTLIADEELVDIDPSNGLDGYPPLPGTWCDIATVTDGPLNLGTAPPHDLADALALVTESLDADTLCHEVREALLQVRKTTEDAVISAGTVARWDVEINNSGSATLTDVVIVDTLDQALFNASQAEGGVFRVIVHPPFGDPDTLEPDSRIFEVPIGDLPPTDGPDLDTLPDDFFLVYTVEITTPGQEGLFCNRVTASGETPVGTISDSDIACVTTTVTIELDVANEDGFIDAAGAFQSAKETFVVGEGGNDADSLAFVYQVTVTNQSAFAATNVRVVDEVAPNTGAIACRRILATAPGGGANPSVGSVVGGAACASTGFTWNIGTLNGGAAATIYFRAEALAPQNTVGNRVRLTADQLTGEIIDEEPTTVTAN